VRSFLMPARPVRSRRSVLSLQPLEGRLTPAGNIVASVSPLGLLLMTGDVDANDVTLTVTPTNVTLTGNAGTTVNGSATPAVLGLVKSIKTDLKGGNDTLSIDGTASFSVAGAVAITLGDGDNTLNLVTTGKIDLGALTVKAGDGSDIVNIQGGAGLGSQVKGAASFNYANGGSSTNFTEMRFGVGVTVIATDAVGIPNEVIGTNTTVVKTVSANLGNSVPSVVHFIDSAIGGLKETGNSVLGILQNTQVIGSINLKGVFQADLQVEATTVTGSVALTAPNPNFSADGAGSTINGNLLLNGVTGWTSSAFQSTTLTEVKGNVTVTGGWFNDQFTTNGNFKVGKNLTFTLNGGDNTVEMGDGTAAVTIGGNLKYKGGAGADSITLNRVTLTGLTATTGSTLIQTLAGNDSLAIDNGSTFAKTFKADLGSGNDSITMGQLIGATAPVTFSGTAKILAGTGDDSLFLGLDAGSGGDANSRVVFSGPGNIVDGGDGIDFFDSVTGQFSGVTPIGWNP
jgi:hypothetical protein